MPKPVPFMDPPNLTLSELLRPLSAMTMPLSARWSIGGKLQDHEETVRSQRIGPTYGLAARRRWEKRKKK